MYIIIMYIYNTIMHCMYNVHMYIHTAVMRPEWDRSIPTDWLVMVMDHIVLLSILVLLNTSITIVLPYMILHHVICYYIVHYIILRYIMRSFLPSYYITPSYYTIILLVCRV